MILSSCKKTLYTCLGGAISTLVRLRGHGLLILMYHRFMADDEPGYVLKQRDFREQIRFITKHFTVVSLDEYLLLPEGARGDIPNPIALTVDDGYRNFLRFAFPVLQDHKVLATMFIPVNFIEHGGWMWQDRNKHILRNAKTSRVVLEWDGYALTFNVATFENLMKSLDNAYDFCMRLSLEERKIFSLKLAEAAGVTLPYRPDAEFEPLSWEEIREMDQAGIRFGSHTMNHEILTRLDHVQLRHELHDSKMILEERLGHEIHGFCYPNGDFDARVADEAKKCGYLYAVTTRGGYNFRTRDLMALRRESAPGLSETEEMVHCLYISPLKHHVMSMVDNS